MSGKLLIVVFFIASVILHGQCQKLSSGPNCFIRKDNALLNTNYFQDGDLIFGGIFTVHYFYDRHQKKLVDKVCKLPVPSFYKYVLAFMFAIDEINKNPYILPNVTLGYHVTDSCNNENKAVENVLQIISGPGDLVPNYSCLSNGKLVGVIGDQSSKTSLQIIQHLNIYGYTQISYGATNPLFSNKKMYPSFFQTLPRDQTQYLAIVKLLKHFDWTWIGVIASDDDGGDTQSQELMKQAESYDICIEFILKMKTDDLQNENNDNEKNRRIFQKSTSKVIVLCGTISFHSVQFIEEQSISGNVKTLIIPAGSNIHIISSVKHKSSCHGSLIFSSPSIKIPHLKTFLENISLQNRPNDPILEHILIVYFNCKPSNPILKIIAEEKYLLRLRNCSRTVKLHEIGSNHYYTEAFRTTYHVYDAVYAMAHALHEGFLHMPRNFSCKHMLKYFLRKLHFQDPMGKEVHFNDKGEMTTHYHINNFRIAFKSWLILKHVGTFNLSVHEEDQLFIDTRKIFWNNDKTPVSKCTEECPPGYRRILMNGRHKCCFECLQCHYGEISNETDKRSCIKCPRDQWPNDNNQCAPKETEYLSFTEDSITLFISVIVIFLFLKTSVILGIFTLFRDTPIVRATNQSLSFFLLVSMMLSFLCIFLFLGRPTHVTCMLRQTLFGIIFSVAISSILSKTIMVYMAFKATKPGSKCRKFIGVKITNCLVFVCSFTQTILCIFWLSTAPPFPEKNYDLYVDKIILQCNEGSLVAFSIFLGYIGFLAAISFVVAFLARNLPDSFNEAKNITFSMLVVCSVWVAFIPAYLSVTGISTVLVEIFAILSSNVGILVCIFYPKCYIIILRPDLNSKGSLLKKT
ncbi:vomeronasal type-2 receptor 26-like [Anomaloglossus baeobatrachus]|uniref:vomeronasal type-2 receptor 26-like n=1 Tax=Anomaloglossus baeobatrachus TaxID=238106 RepID=UPI003F4FE300